MRKVELNMNEQKKYDVIKLVSEKKKTKTRAEVELGLSRRQVDRLVKAYEIEGKSAFKHKARGKSNNRGVTEKMKKKIIGLYLSDTYCESNFQHFTECLDKHESISLSTTRVASILKEADIVSPKANRVTKRKMVQALKAQLEKQKTKEEKVKIEDKIISIEDAHPLRERKKYRGELIQFDASKHFWISKEYWHLHVAIDDASGDITGAYFSKEETLNSYYEVTRQMLQDHGIPHKIITDYRTVFNDNSKNYRPGETSNLTQYGYMCKQLGIELECTMVPQKKGRVERLFNTLQSRLVTEFKIHGIKTMEEANVFLDSYIDEYNNRFGNKVNHTTSVFELSPSKEDINLFLAVLKPRQIHKGHYLRFENHYFMPIDSKGKDILFPNKTEALVITTFDGRRFVSIDEKTYGLRHIKTHELQSENFDAYTEENNTELMIPGFNHPWKYKNFINFAYELQLTAQDWENMKYSSHNILANVDEILRHF